MSFSSGGGTVGGAGSFEVAFYGLDCYVCLSPLSHSKLRKIVLTHFLRFAGVCFVDFRAVFVCFGRSSNFMTSCEVICSYNNVELF